MTNPYAPTSVAEPRARVVPQEGDVMVFRVRFLQPWLVCAVAIVITAGPIAMTIADRSIVLTVVPLVAALWPALCLWFFVTRYPLIVTPEGLRCVDFWNQYQFVRWSDIRDVRPIGMCGLHYLRVGGAQLPRPIWLPLFLRDSAGFWHAVAQLSGPNSLLSQARPGSVRSL